MDDDDFPEMEEGADPFGALTDPQGMSNKSQVKNNKNKVYSRGVKQLNKKPDLAE